MCRTTSRVALLAVPLLACALLGCRANRRPPETDTRFDVNKGLFATVGDARQLTLYEGLPHQGSEPQELAAEKATKDTIQLRGFSFYRPPLDLKADDARLLRNLLGDEQSFRPFTGYKACGGFHPDWCVGWATSAGEYLCLICFGCHEVKVYGPESELYCDIQDDVYKQLKATLKKYRKNRPFSEINRE
jgi:hypothetical protein